MMYYKVISKNKTILYSVIFTLLILLSSCYNRPSQIHKERLIPVDEVIKQENLVSNVTLYKLFEDLPDTNTSEQIPIDLLERSTTLIIPGDSLSLRLMRQYDTPFSYLSTNIRFLIHETKDVKIKITNEDNSLELRIFERLLVKGTYLIIIEPKYNLYGNYSISFIIGENEYKMKVFLYIHA